MTDILERIVEQQGQAPVNQSRGLGIGVNKTLERFQKFSPLKFFGGPDTEVVEN